jgi:NAD-dependent DNA ligase
MSFSLLLPQTGFTKRNETKRNETKRKINARTLHANSVRRSDKNPTKTQENRTLNSRPKHWSKILTDNTGPLAMLRHTKLAAPPQRQRAMTLMLRGFFRLGQSC